MKPAQFPQMIDVIGTERYLTKIDGSHTIVFSATYGFPRGLVYINELAAQRQIQTGYSSTLRGDSLRAEFAVTCSRDQTPTCHVNIGATTPRSGP